VTPLATWVYPAPALGDSASRKQISVKGAALIDNSIPISALPTALRPLRIGKLLKPIRKCIVSRISIWSRLTCRLSMPLKHEPAIGPCAFTVGCLWPRSTDSANEEKLKDAAHPADELPL
jgi:hypothetical protein